MTARDQVLEALKDCPDGLTSKELAAKCDAAEYDPQIVGRVIAGLRQENLIRPGTALRDGGAIWLLGGEPKEPERERITLPYTPDKRPAVSQAARDIAAMRGGSRSAAERPVRAQSTPPATSPASAVVPKTEGNMANEASILKAIQGSPEGLRRSEINKLAGAQADEIIAGLLETKLVKRTGFARGTRYVVAGRSTPPQPVHKRKKVARKSVKRTETKREDRAPAMAAPNGKDAHFAINEHGQLGIEKGKDKLALDPAEFARLRGFIERTEPVWKGAGR